MSEHEHAYRREHGGEPKSKDEKEPEHPHLRPHLDAGVCENCSTNEHVHEGLCRRCRKVLLGEGKILPPEHEERLHQADGSPLHSPAWRRRGA